MMEKKDCMLTAEQYNELYCKAFARLDDVVRLAERAMQELEELQLAMGDRPSAAGNGVQAEKS